MPTKQEIDKIIETYPEKIHCFPRGSFEEQLRKHLCGYFKIKYGWPKKKEME